MKLFISSVRRGLETERDALPGLIAAMGHEASRFEDYTAKAVPSREACLEGVEDADAYLLLLGQHYGDPLPDTGTSPTEEEFTVAKRRGIPILVFRKRDVVPDDRQAAFIERVEDYRAGLFRSSFTDTPDLLARVAAAIRELEQAPSPLSLEPLDVPLTAPWKAFEHRGSRSTATILEIHAIPTLSTPVAATTLATLPTRLARLGREHAFFSESEGLDVGLSEGLAHAAARTDRYAARAGMQVTSTGTVSVWSEMPSDMLGVILDAADLAPRMAAMLRLASELLPTTGRVAFAVGLHSLWSVTEGSAADLGHRSSASLSARQADAALVEARDSVSISSVRHAADEIARELSTRLLLRFRDVTRW